MKSELLSLEHTCFRPHPQGQGARLLAQDLCSQAIDEFPWLNFTEKQLLIRATGSHPQDANSFCKKMYRQQPIIMKIANQVP